jgi:hypothetical protein
MKSYKFTISVSGKSRFSEIDASQAKSGPISAPGRCESPTFFGNKEDNNNSQTSFVFHTEGEEKLEEKR